MSGGGLIDLAGIEWMYNGSKLSLVIQEQRRLSSNGSSSSPPPSSLPFWPITMDSTAPAPPFKVETKQTSKQS